MKTFKDNADNEWSVEINVAALKRIRSLTGTDLLEVISGGDLLERLMRDPVLLCDIIYALVKPQADEKRISDEAFGAAMAGDAIDSATAALLDELVAFCPSPRDRANLGRVLLVVRQAMDRARDVVEAKIAGGEIERIVEQSLSQASSGISSGAAPASSASIPPT
ncbi:MAG: hypothetical protein KJZ69_19080 [Phycisphaerales bacterium]|nr:hypothetical protein [Phycisphaerales bacterium]